MQRTNSLEKTQKIACTDYLLVAKDHLSLPKIEQSLPFDASAALRYITDQ